MKKKAVVVHSGGMDSSLCLALALREHAPQHVLSLSFDYLHRHRIELESAAHICQEWGVDHTVIPLECLTSLTEDALTHPAQPIQHIPNQPPNTLVVGRNGLFAHLAGIHAHHLGASTIYLGVMQLEEANSGYRDCSRAYMDICQDKLRIDLDLPTFSIATPLVDMTKLETMELAHQLGVLPFLLEHTVTCYNGISREGCRTCPACRLRNQGVAAFAKKYPNTPLPFTV